MFVDSGTIALTSLTSDFSLYSSPTLSVTDTAGSTTNYSLGSLSGFNITMSFGSSFGSVKSATFSGYTSSYSFSNPIYIGF